MRGRTSGVSTEEVHKMAKEVSDWQTRKLVFNGDGGDIYGRLRRRVVVEGVG